MFDKDLYMQSVDPPSYKEELFLFYYIDKDIVVEMVKDDDSCFVAIYNDQNDSSVSFQVSKDKVKGLADFLNKHLGNKS